jgi:hypothetical protein
MQLTAAERTVYADCVKSELNIKNSNGECSADGTVFGGIQDLVAEGS